MNGESGEPAAEPSQSNWGATSPSLRQEVLFQAAAVLEAKHLRNSASAQFRSRLLTSPQIEATRADVRAIAVVGAGASAERFPRAVEISRMVRNQVGDSFVEPTMNRLNFVTGADVNSIDTLLAAVGVGPERDAAVRDYLGAAFSQVRPTTLTYELIAHLLKHRYLDAVVNFNFDELLDDSIRFELGDGEYRFVNSDRNCHQVTGDPDHPDYVPLHIKPHGTASEPSSLRYTLNDYYGTGGEVRRILSELIGTGPVLILNFGYGMADPDFCEILAAPARVTIIDCSYQPMGSRAIAAFARHANEDLDKLERESESKSRGLISSVTIAREFGVDTNSEAVRSPDPPHGPVPRQTLRERDDPGPNSATLRRRGRRISYYWLDHAWVVADTLAESASKPMREGLADDVERPPLQLDAAPLTFVQRTDTGQTDAFRRKYVRKVIGASGALAHFDSGALQLLDLTSYLEHRARPKARTQPAPRLGSQADSKAPADSSQTSLHFYRSDLRHLVVGLFCEYSTLARSSHSDARAYWHDRALLELALLMVESRGVTTLEDLAVSRARRFFDRYRAFDQRAHFQDLHDELDLEPGQRGVRYLRRSRRVRSNDPAPAHPHWRVWSSDDTPVVDLRDAREADAERTQAIECGCVPDLGQDELADLVLNLFRHCSTIDSSLQSEFVEFLTEAFAELASARMDVEIAVHDDLVCTGIFRSAVRLHTHSALSGHSRLVLTRLQGSINGALPAGRSHLWVATTTGGFLRDEYLLTGLQEIGHRVLPGDPDGDMRSSKGHLRPVDVRVLCSSEEVRRDIADRGGPSTNTQPNTTSFERNISTWIGRCAAHDIASVTIETSARFLPWWQINRHLMLAIADGTPVAGVYFVRSRLGRTVSPVFLSDPDDLCVLQAMFRRMWRNSFYPEPDAWRDLPDPGTDHHEPEGPERRSGDDRRSGLDRRAAASGGDAQSGDPT